MSGAPTSAQEVTVAIGDRPTDVLTDPDIELLRRRFEQQLPRFEEAALWAERRVREVLRNYAVFAMTSSRAKAWPAVERKIRRSLGDPRWTREGQVESFDRLVTDVAGCRVLVYRQLDVDRAIHALLQRFVKAAMENADQCHEKASGYKAHHLLVSIGHEARRDSILDTTVEIQVVTLAAHVYNEIEHSAIYKQDDPDCKHRVAAEVEVLLDATRTVDRRAQELLEQDATVRMGANRAISSAFELAHVLERKTGTPVLGEFELVFQFAASLSDSAQGMKAQDVAEALRVGKSGELAKRGTPPDDAAAILLALVADHAMEFRKFALRGHSDSPTVVDVLRRLDGSFEPQR